MKVAPKAILDALAIEQLLLFALLISLQGCLRYVPSVKELARNADEIQVAGEDEFRAHDSEIQRRLDAIVRERSHLLDRRVSTNGYRLGAGDTISIEVYGFPELKSDTAVSPAGSVSLPLVGEVSLGGMDLDTARDTLVRRYSHYIRSPRIDLGFESLRANHVYVSGEVAKPGMYPLAREGTLLTEVLAEAGGRTDQAASRIVLLPARSAGTEHTGATGVEIELESLVGGIDQSPLLVPLVSGDQIIVPAAGTFEVDGEVSKPGSYKLSSRISAIGAIAAAGGFTYSADVKNVEVIREIGAGRKAVMSLDLEEVGLRGGRDVRLREGDLVRVPSEPTRFSQRQVVETLNTVFRGVGVSGKVN